MFIVQEFKSGGVAFESTYWVAVLVYNISKPLRMRSRFLGNKRLGNSIKLNNYTRKHSIIRLR
jgi:hypothetical protein